MTHAHACCVFACLQICLFTARAVLASAASHAPREISCKNDACVSHPGNGQREVLMGRVCRVCSGRPPPRMGGRSRSRT